MGLASHAQQMARIAPANVLAHHVWVTIRLAETRDVPRMHDILHTAARDVPKEQVFVDDEEFLAAHVADKGFTLIGKEDGQVVAFQIVRFPRQDDDNLGHDLDVDPARVAHMEICAVHPRYQRRGWQSRLVAAAIEAIPQDYDVVGSTVHPDNAPSLAALRRSGFTDVALINKYGGRPRVLLRLDLARVD